MYQNQFYQDQDPSVFLFLVDQSGSMNDSLPSGKTRCEVIEDSINRILQHFLSVYQERVRTIPAYDIYVGILGYGGRGINNFFQGIGSSALVAASQLSLNKPHVERRIKKEKEIGGKIKEEIIDFPVWIKLSAFGGTPFCGGLFHTITELRDFIAQNPAVRAPIVLNVIDGMATDGDPEELGRMLLFLHSDKGNVKMFNLHLSDNQPQNICFPETANQIFPDYLKILFSLSSPLPTGLQKELRIPPLAYGLFPKGFMYNINDAGKITEFFDLFTRLDN